MMEMPEARSLPTGLLTKTAPDEQLSLPVVVVLELAVGVLLLVLLLQR
jgi:hypothetical protein